MNTLPNTYQQVEYIESTGTQYIDTGVNADSKLQTIIDMQYNDISNINNTNFGAIKASPTIIRYHIMAQGTNKIWSVWLKGTANGFTNISVDLNRHLLDLDVPNGKLALDNNKISFTLEAFDTGLNFWLFARNSDSQSAIYYNKSKLYRCKMIYEGTTIRDFVPCYRKSDNTIGLYDVINDVFYTNNGTGTFIKGNNVTISDKLSYLKQTVDQIDEKSIDLFGKDFVENATFRELAEAYAGMYDKMNKVTASGDEVSLTPAAGKIEITPKGNTYQDNLPSEYQQVEYIESSGTQYIDTGYQPNQGDEFTFKNVSRNTSNLGALFSAGDGTYQFILLMQSTTYYKYFSSGAAHSMLSENLSNIEIKATGDGKLYYNNELKIDDSSTTRGEVDTNLFLFKRANDTSYISAKMGEIIIKNNNIVIRDYIPCYRKSDNEIGLYDLVTNVFLINQGTGTFKKGNDIPNPDYPQDIKVVTGENNVIIRGRNLSEIDRNDSNNNPKTIGGLTYNFNKNTITVNGTATASATGISFILKRRFKPGTYTISGLPNKEVGSNDRGTVYIWNDTTPNTGLSNPDETKTNIYNKTTVTIEKDSYIGFRIISSNTSTGLEYNQTYNIQIEQGSTATTYEPYIEPIEKELNLGNIELAKIGDYSDYIYKNNGSWYKKEVICKKTLSNITGWTQGNPSNRFVAQTDDKGNTSISPICTHLIGGTLTSHNDIGGVAIQNLTTQIRFNCYVQAYANNVNGFKNWLFSAKPVIYYVLESPKDIQITGTTLINQLESLNRTIIPAQTIIIKTESNEENAKLNITATAIRKEDGE